MTIKPKEETFKFFVPIEDITKGTKKDANGNVEMIIGGIASTPHEDSDGEFLDPNGFQLDFFKRYGFINWHHQAKGNPAAIIGEPIMAEIRPNEGLYIKAKLYPDNQIAKDVYELSETLSKNSTRRLGFSIEGKVVQRGSNDKKSPLYNQIKKARITGCAITPTPKNAYTLADIIKGEGILDSSEEADDNYEIVLESIEKGKPVQYIVDVQRPSGETVRVDKEFNITILKAQDNELAVESEKDQSTNKEESPSGRILTESETFEELFKRIPSLTINQAKNIYKIVEHYSNQRNEKS